MMTASQHTAFIDLAIVTVCFNAEKTISRTFQGVLVQTVPPREYILIDGGSKDATLSLAERFRLEAPFPVRIFSEKDRGISDAFNKGIRLCEASWIHLLNADDFYAHETILAELQPVLEQTAKSVVLAAGTFEQADGSLERRNGYRKNGSFRYGMTALHPACFVRRTTYDQVGVYSERFRVSMDYDWLLRAERFNPDSFLELDLVTTQIGYGGEAFRNYERGIREVAVAQLQWTDISFARVVWHYSIRILLRKTLLGKILFESFTRFKIRRSA